MLLCSLTVTAGDTLGNLPETVVTVVLDITPSVGGQDTIQRLLITKAWPSLQLYISSIGNHNHTKDVYIYIYIYTLCSCMCTLPP